MCSLLCIYIASVIIFGPDFSQCFSVVQIFVSLSGSFVKKAKRCPDTKWTNKKLSELIGENMNDMIVFFWFFLHNNINNNRTAK